MTNVQIPDNGDASFDQTERRNRRAVLEAFRDFGPIFRSTTWGHKRVFVYGLSRCSSLLHEHGDKLRVDNVDITPLTPSGFIRSMGGIQHQRVRSCIAGATNPNLLFLDPTPFQDMFNSIASGLPMSPTPSMLRTLLNEVSTAFLVYLYYGALPEQFAHDSFCELHRSMGPNGFCFNLGEVQVDAARQLAEQLRRLKGRGEAHRGSVLSEIRSEDMDDTVMFNLIYMVEIGRYDIGGLLLWIVKHLADDAQLQERICAEVLTSPDRRGTLAEATVLETLRFDKAERLDRIIESSFEFEGYHINAGDRLRLCLWESHRSPAVFERPDEFDPSRFLGRRFRRDEFAPFGLDRHSCIGAEVTVRFATICIHLLANWFPISIVADGPPVRGPYHWLPNRKLAVTFSGMDE